MLIQYRQASSHVLNNDRIIHSYGTFEGSNDACELVMSIINYYQNNSILIYCRSHEEVKKVYRGIDKCCKYNDNINDNDYYRERIRGIDKLESNMYSCRKDEQKNDHGSSYNNNINQYSSNHNYNYSKHRPERNFDLYQLQHAKPSGFRADSNDNNETRSSKHVSNFSGIYGELNVDPSKSNKDMYSENRKKDFERIMKSSNGKRKIIVTTDLYNNVDIGNSASIAIHYGLPAYGNAGFHDSGYTNYGYYMRRIGRLQGKNCLSINLMINSSGQIESFKKMMHWLHIKDYYKLDSIVRERKKSQTEKSKKFNCDEILLAMQHQQQINDEFWYPHSFGY